MGIPVVVGHLRQILPGDPHPVRQVVISGGDDHFARQVDPLESCLDLLSRDTEGTVRSLDREGPLVGVDPDLVALRDPTVIFEGFDPVGLLPLADKGEISDLEQLRGSEEDELGWIVIEGVDQAALLDHDVIETRPCRLDRAGEARRPSADDDDVQLCWIFFAHSLFPDFPRGLTPSPAPLRGRADWLARWRLSPRPSRRSCSTRP